MAPLFDWQMFIDDAAMFSGHDVPYSALAQAFATSLDSDTQLLEDASLTSGMR